MGISAWLVPNTHDSQVLEQLMKPSYPTTHLLSKSSYPAFKPHVTLANHIPASKSLEDIRGAIDHPPRETNVQNSDLDAGKKSKLEVEFARLAVGSQRFQSVFIRCKEIPKLLNFRDTFHANLGIEVKTPLFPHLSLAYIDDEDAEQGERDRFARDLMEGGRVKEDGESLSVLCTPEQEERVDIFEVEEVWIVRCFGTVEEWEVLDKITL